MLAYDLVARNQGTDSVMRDSSVLRSSSIPLERR